VAAVPGARLSWCCESDPAARERVEPLPRGCRFSDSLDEVLADSELDGVLLATPVRRTQSWRSGCSRRASTVSSRSRSRSRWQMRSAFSMPRRRADAC